MQSSWVLFGFLLFSVVSFAAPTVEVKPPSHVVVEELSFISKGDIRRVIAENNQEIYNCYKIESMKKPNLHGVVKFEFKIVRGGKVQKAKIVETSTLKDPSLHSCLLNTLRAWSFPEPAKGDIIRVSYPLTFASRD